MSRASHKLLVDGEGMPFVLKGLRSPSIKEPPVALTLNGKAAGQFHGVEVFEKVVQQKGNPQTIADLICNTYCRLTYQKPNGTSATFGTSIIGATSFRDNDNTLHLIPSVSSAEAHLGDPHRLKISVVGTYGDMAHLSSVRTYTTEANIHSTTMVAEITFVTLKEITLRKSLLGTDALRLFSISSMYQSPTCYDGNLIRYKTGDTTKSLDLRTTKQRSRYIFGRSSDISEIELVKQLGSTGKLHTPGSTDSPSLRARALDASIPTAELGIQAYLSESLNPNDDSLSVWLEWIACPAVLPKGKELWAKIEFSATPPV